MYSRAPRSCDEVGSIMKSKVPLILSLGINVLLVGLLLRPAPKPDAQAPAPESRTNVAASSGSTKSSPKPQIVIHTNAPTHSFSWREVESPDYREYIANLRSIGCPEETIRDIIRADVNKLYDEKRKQLPGAKHKFEYWKPGSPLAGLMGDPESLKAARALQEEKNRVLKALGIEPDPMDQMMAAAGGNPMDVMFDFLPEDKRALVTKTMTDFQNRMMENAKDIGNDPSAIVKMQQDMEKELKAVLTPDEFLDYQLRFSTTATMMRMQLNGFDPSESEFLAVFKLRAAFDEQHSPVAMDLTDAEQKARTEAQQQLNSAIKQTLGDDRYADYQRSQDYQYQQIYRIVNKANLDTDVANKVYDMKTIAEAQAAKIRQDSSLNAQQQTAALQAVRQETERSIHQVMGDDAWELYNRPANVYWLNTVAPAPATTQQTQ